MSAERIRLLWYGLMPLAGLGFGLLSKARPFGQGLLTHPVVVYLAATAVVLLAFRLLSPRPVAEIIPDRALMIGLVGGIGAFIAGNLLVGLFG